ncbi:MAG: CAP domain-containing protein [Patescibacteria group bacterium]
MLKIKIIIKKLELAVHRHNRVILLVLLLITFASVTTTQYASHFYERSQSKTPNNPALQTAKNNNQEINKADLKKKDQPDNATGSNTTTSEGQAANQAQTPPAATPKKTTAPTPAPVPTPAPAPEPAPPPAQPPEIASESSCPGQSSTTNTAAVLACMASYARAYYGIGPISSNSSLVDSAVAKAQDMLDCGYSHTACGRAFDYWFSIKGYTGGWRGENIAQGYTSNGEVFIAWMNSSGHRANILNPNFQHIGCAISSSGLLWVMQLGGY